MAKKGSRMATETESSTQSQPAQTQPTQVPAPQEPDGLQPIYANFARVTGSPEELVLDFGLNPSPFNSPAVSVKVQQRLVMNYYTAKRLWAALGMAIQRHENAFGVLETDVNKRVLPQSQRK
jgi:hypothetical protein